MPKIPQRTSYRDPSSTVRVEDGRLTRTFSPEGEEAFLSAHEAGVLAALVDDGLLVPYNVITENRFEVQSELIPFVSYPSEWSASMLRDAGELTLEVARRLWADGYHLRDASAYNVVFRGTDPVFVDLGSIGMGHTPLWVGYGQFCDHFLNPLLIETKLDIPFRELWTLEGVSVGTTSRLLKGRRSFGGGAFRNVKLRARLESEYTDVDASVRTSARRDLALRPEQVDNIMAGLAGTLSSLNLRHVSHWSDYEATNSYNDAEEAEREWQDDADEAAEWDRLNEGRVDKEDGEEETPSGDEPGHGADEEALPTEENNAARGPEAEGEESELKDRGR